MRAATACAVAAFAALASGALQSAAGAARGAAANDGDDTKCLSQFGDAMHYKDWVSNRGWGGGGSKCDWEGITCDGSGRVTNIHLDRNGMHGSLQDLTDLPRCTKLIEFAVHGNNVTGESSLVLCACCGPRVP